MMIKYMEHALSLARMGVGKVNPNPLVGAVIVKDGEIIGEGYHEQYGGLHAERNALASCLKSPRGATMYVTLEPCCHYGKTPPCTQAILESGIQTVVIGALDPNPMVSGKGAGILRAAGVGVVTGVLQEACERLNEVFFHYIETGLPFVAMKYAMTMDGKIATSTGQSKWITGEEARARVHQDRNAYIGIMVGVGTVLADDPVLNCRLPGGRNPIRIICDTNLRTPLTAKLVQTAREQKTIIATANPDRGQTFVDAGCQLIVVPKENGHINLHVLMQKLGQQGIDGILLEGGGLLHASALASGIVQKVQAYVAPKIFGGGITPVGDFGVQAVEQAVRLTHTTITKLGSDYLFESGVEYPCLQES